MNESTPSPHLEPSPSTPTDGLDILLEMARSGQVDPWNLDIVQVANQYLQVMTEMKAADLRITGKNLLYLAILLRMKSDKLAGIDFLNGPANEPLFEEGFEPDLESQRPAARLRIHSLEEALQRRTSTKQPRIRAVTLTDLIEELQKYEQLERQRSLREKLEKDDQRRLAVDYSEFTAEDIEELAHEEFLEDNIFRLQLLLERFFIQRQSISLTELVEECGLDKISAFLALLFLTSRGEVEMSQEAFYEELYIHPVDLTEQTSLETNEAL